jgi:hypothetical protein
MLISFCVTDYDYYADPYAQYQDAAYYAYLNAYYKGYYEELGVPYTPQQPYDPR